MAMKTEQETIGIARFITLFEVFTSILKDTCSIEEMEKLLFRVNQWVEAEKDYRRRNK